MWGLTAGGFLNIFLDPVFIFTLKLGIAGAAIATALSQCVSFVILLLAFLRGKSIVHLRLACVSRRFGDYWLILSTGFPTICRQGLASLATALLNRQAAAYGDAAVAAMGSELHLHVNSNGKDVVIVVPTADIDLDTVHGGHKSIQYTFQPRLMHFFDKDTEKNLF